MKRCVPLVFALVVILASCAPPPVVVADKYMDTVVRNDADAMIAMLSDNMVMVVDGGPFFHKELTGKEALRQYMQGNAATGFRLELAGDPT